MAEFRDNFPLYCDVRVPGDDRVHTYLGFEDRNTRRVAVAVKGEPFIVWWDRQVVTRAAD